MNDKTRELLVLKSAYAFIACWCLLIAVSVIFGKAHGRLILVTIIPAYSMYYAVMYNSICKGYSEEGKRISAFGIIGRGTFVGALYYLSLCILAFSLLLLFAVFVGASGGN